MQRQHLIYILEQSRLHECCSIIHEPLPSAHPCCHVSRSLSILKRPRWRAAVCMYCNDQARAASHLTEQNQQHQCRCWKQSRCWPTCENPPGNNKNVPASPDLIAVVTVGKGAVSIQEHYTNQRSQGKAGY